MNTKIINLEHGLIRIDKSELSNSSVHIPKIKRPVVGFVFYLSGNGQIEIRTSANNVTQTKEPKQSSSFFVDPSSCKIRQVYPSNQLLHKVSILIHRSYLEQLFPDASDNRKNYFHKLLRPDQSYVDNAMVNINSDTLRSLHDLSDNRYRGHVRSVWMQGKMLELISSYYQSLNEREKPTPNLSKSEIQKIVEAEKILCDNFLAPLSLDELARATNLNTLKLKTGFKQIFGKPVFSYLRDKRLKKAHHLLEKDEMNVTQAAYSVGYSSIGSFSNAFQYRFGYRPSEVHA